MGGSLPLQKMIKWKHRTFYARFTQSFPHFGPLFWSLDLHSTYAGHGIGAQEDKARLQRSGEMSDNLSSMGKKNEKDS